jgi:hypothetical protein
MEKLRLALGGRTALDEAVSRRRVSDLIRDYRVLCADIGPVTYAADLEAPEDADLRMVGYMAVWRDVPALTVWEDVMALDAVDLLIDAAVEGFEHHLTRA